MLLNLLLLVLTSVAAVGGSVNVMENYEEHPEQHPDDVPEEEREQFYQYVKKQEENFQNASMNANVAPLNTSNVVAESFQANVAPNANASNVGAESFQAQVNVSPQANASNGPTVEGFTGGSFAAF